ncbi:MAG: UDP-N-acetylmuramoylalanyl-D-glutamyl-2, 6-diaminopimelate--D-alanyl-D-alanine ligase, partial [Hyphomicrobiaceae bacterium]
GPDSAALHAGLAESILANGVDLVFACGPNMRHLYDALPPKKRATWAPTSSELTIDLLECVRGGDVVMIKGSNGSRMAPLVSALLARHIPAQSSG